MKQFTKKIHMVGIGGAGMCPLAEVLQARGHTISGSDRMSSAATARLESLGIKIQYDHTPELVKGVELLVYSSAVREDNPERVYAKENGIQVLRRAEVLGDLMRDHYSICISGTHGKTTTTSLTGEVFNNAGLQPTVLIGGMLIKAESHAFVGASNIMIAEADEYDRSFLAMYPSLVIITNIEADHLDCYGTLDNIKDAFVGFTERLPFFGAVIACGDDPGVRDILPRIGRTVITYGINENADYMAKDICCSSGKSIFTVVKRGEQLGSVILNLPGMHNVANALAVIAAASETGIPFVSVVSSLSQFQGVRRRFEIVADIKGVTIVDDYAHHPGEIKATLAAARQSGYKRIIAVFQPHLYTRTRDFMDDFVTSLSAADIMYVTDIYKSREESIAGVSSEVITRKLSETGYLQAHYIKNKDDLSHILQAVIAEGDVVIFMGAGDIWKSAVELAEVMRNG